MHYVHPSPGRRPGKPAPAARPARATGDHGSVLDAVMPYLTCAYCGAALARRGGSVRCAAGHVFDIPRPGYVSLLPPGATVPARDPPPTVLKWFPPRNGPELRRVLSPAGRLLVVTPMPDHLGELIGPLGLLTVDPRKQERLTEKLSPYFALAARREHRVMLSLTRGAVSALAAMGPSSWHADPPTLAARIGPLREPISVTLAAMLSVYQPSAGPRGTARP